MVPCEALERVLLGFKGKSFGRGSFPHHKDIRSVEGVVKEFRGYQQRFAGDVQFGGRNNIVWFTETEALDGAISQVIRADDVASRCRDILGLPYEQTYLIDIQFMPGPSNPGHKPTVFHANFYHGFMPSPPQDGWGRTLDLASLSIGCKESVRQGSVWPEFTHRTLGQCSALRSVPEKEWVDYLDRRIESLRTWAKGRQGVVEDLEDFLRRWS